MNEGALDFIDPATGETLVSVPLDVVRGEWQTAYDAALAETGWVEPEREAYRPDFWILATSNGTDCLLEDLDEGSEESGWWPQLAAVNGDVVVARLGEDWLRWTID